MKLKVEKIVCCTDSYVLCYANIYSSTHIFGFCIILSCISSKKYSKFILTHTFLVLVTVGLGHRKLYTFIGGQRAETFENHCFKGSYSLELGVVDNLCADVILGLDFLKINRSTTSVTGGPRQPIRVGDQKMCCVAAANVKPPRIFLFLNPKVRPISTPSRRFNAEDSRFITEEINKLLDQGIIEHSECPRRAQVLVTKDEKHKRRMVIDYCQTINRFTELDAYLLPKIDHQVHELPKCKLFSTLDLKSAYYQIPLDPKHRLYTAFVANVKLYQYRRLPFGVTNGVSAFQRIIDGIISQNSLQRTYAHLDNITIGGTSKADHDQNLKISGRRVPVKLDF